MSYWSDQMNGTDAYWRAEMLRRFADREDIGKEELYKRYFADLPKEDVLKCLELIEFEYELPAGLLRPAGRLEKLFEPVASKNWWRSLVYQIRAGDRENELTLQLSKGCDGMACEATGNGSTPWMISSEHGAGKNPRRDKRVLPNVFLTLRCQAVDVR
jgi:hypothetical protein